jgi:HK97 family phage prohead protease
VRLLVNHEGVPLASTKAGTMTLSVDARGLVVDVAHLDPSNPTAAELISAMSRGDIDQMSFAFSEAGGPYRSADGTRELREVILYDVSVVTYPWYDTTSVGLTGDRDMDRALVSLRSLTAEQRAEVQRIPARVACRTAPAGAISWSDQAEAVVSALEVLHEAWCFLEDIGDDWVVYQIYPSWDTCYLASWTAGADGIVIGTPTEVVETYVPVADPAAAARSAISPAEARDLLASAAA